MSRNLRVLNVEDSEQDVALLVRHLTLAGYEVISDRVDTPAAMRAALETREWDVILCDYSMPQFDALGALALMKEIKLDISFIIISGTIGEAAAVEAMRAGAHDYLMKDSLARLVPAIEREMNEAENRRARRQAEEQLRLQTAALQAAANAILITDRAGKIIWVNPAFTQHTGYSFEEVRGKNPRLLKSGKQDRAFYREMWETILSGKVWRNTVINRRKDGALNQEDLTITPIRDNTGEITHFVAIKQDINKAGALQSAIFNSANFSSIATDAKGVIQIFNVGAERMLGYEAAEVMNKITPAEISDPQEVIARAKALSVELATTITPGFEALVFKASRGIEDIYELTYIRKDGSRFPAIVSVTALRDDEEGIIGYLLIGTDNTARKQVEAEQKKLDQRLRDQQFYTRSLIESNIDAIMTTDPSGIITDVNKQMEALTGYTRDELIGAPFKNYFTDPERAEAGIKLVLNEKKVTDYELTVRARDGKKTVVSYNATTFYDRDRTLQGVFAAARDVTERKRFERALQESNVELEGAKSAAETKTHELASMTQQLWQASKLATMGELAASVAHELNNPLATISLHAEVLVGQLAADDPNRRSLLVIEQEVERMATLVSNLLLFSRRSHRQISTIDIGEELQNSLEFINYHLRSHRINVATDFADDLPSVQADRQQLRQVFLNLLTNASDAMPEGGTLTVRAKQQALESGAPAVVIEFSDTGIGIEPEDLPKLWESFFTTKPEGKGTGLGLPICRRTVEEHRGTIDIESQPGKGTTVRIILPAMKTGAIKA